jgi:hypothetical protein
MEPLLQKKKKRLQTNAQYAIPVCQLSAQKKKKKKKKPRGSVVFLFDQFPIKKDSDYKESVWWRWRKFYSVDDQFFTRGDDTNMVQREGRGNKLKVKQQNVKQRKTKRIA